MTSSCHNNCERAHVDTSFSFPYAMMGGNLLYGKVYADKHSSKRVRACQRPMQNHVNAPEEPHRFGVF